MAKRKLPIYVQFAELSFLMLILCFALVRISIVTMTVRAVFIGTALLGLMTSAAFVRRISKKHRWIAAAVAFVIVVLVLGMYGRQQEIDQDALRKAYLERLGSFQGVRYRWGGETHFGIDCSGLARVSLWQAMARQGIASRSGRLLGPMLWRFWWQDISALAMRNETFGYTKLIDETPELAGYDSSLLKPGDLAVMNSGIHVLVYFGDGKWIEASPEDQKVTANMAPKDTKRAWFTTGPVRIMRWWIFD